MTDYFKDARSVTRALGRVRRAALPPAPTPIRLIGENLMWVVEGITFADAATAIAAPAEWLRVFDAAVSRNVPVADDALALMEREQQKHNYPPEVFHPTPEHQHRILQFMRPRPGLSARLSEMRDCGLLGAIFPELNEIACRVTRDFYHKYTVDEHTLLTVRNAERLLNNPRFAPILREVHAPELLVLALLYHDVGKAREGDHSIVGAEMAAGMSRRLGLDADARADDRLPHPEPPEDVAHRVPPRHRRAGSRAAVRVDVQHRRAAEDARAADAVRRRRRQPGDADALEGRAALAVVRRRLQSHDPRLRRRRHRSRSGAGRRAPGEPARRHLGSRDGELPRRAAAAIPDSVFATTRSIVTSGCRATSGRTRRTSSSRRRPRRGS